MNNEGIETPEFGQKRWSEISSINVHTGGYGEDRKDELHINISTGEYEFGRETYGDWNEEYEEYEDYHYEEIDEITYEKHKNEDNYFKFERSDSFTKNVQELTINPDKLEYLIKVYQARARSNRRINIDK